MNRIFLIGNGFDLAHGLKTSYSHFINWCFNYEENVSKVMKEIDAFAANYNIKDDNYNLPLDFDHFTLQLSYINFEKYQEQIRINPHLHRHREESDFEEFTHELNNHHSAVEVEVTFQNKFLGKLIRLQKRRENDTVKWVDIENFYFQELNDTKNDIENLYREFEEVKSLLKKYLTSLEQPAFSNPEIEQLLKYKIKSFEINGNKLGEVNRRKLHEQTKLASDVTEYTHVKDVFISFNYTETLKVYNINDAIHIHGTLKDDIIFGFGDEEADKFKEIRNKENPLYQRNIKTFDYLERSEYAEVENILNSDLYQVVILGHSCGIADKTFLKTLFEHKNCVSIKPYYFKNEIDDTDNYRDITIGIARCFEDNAALMRSTVVDKTKTEPFSVLEKVVEETVEKV